MRSRKAKILKNRSLNILKYVVPLIVVFSATYFLVRRNILLSVPTESVFYNDLPLPLDAPYAVYKSLSGDVFCYHLRGGPQYLISPARGEVSLINKGVEVKYFGPITYTRDILTKLSVPEERRPVPYTRLVTRNGYVEFTGMNYERWRIPY